MGPLPAIGASILPSIAAQSEAISRLTAPILISPPYYPTLRLVGAFAVAGIFVAETIVRCWPGKKVDPKIGLLYDTLAAGALFVSLCFNPYLRLENFSADWLVPEVLAGLFLSCSVSRHLRDRGKRP